MGGVSEHVLECVCVCVECEWIEIVVSESGESTFIYLYLETQNYNLIKYAVYIGKGTSLHLINLLYTVYRVIFKKLPKAK